MSRAQTERYWAEQQAVDQQRADQQRMLQQVVVVGSGSEPRFSNPRPRRPPSQERTLRANQLSEERVETKRRMRIATEMKEETDMAQRLDQVCSS